MSDAEHLCGLADDEPGPSMRDAGGCGERIDRDPHWPVVGGFDGLVPFHDDCCPECNS